MIMKNNRKQSLETNGWKFGDAAIFLNLSKKEITLIEIKLTLYTKTKNNKQLKLSFPQ